MVVDDRIHERQARCQQHLIRLLMLARADVGSVVPQQAAAEIHDATQAVLAEVTAAGDLAVLTDGGRRCYPEPFLGVRLARLEATADAAIQAALAGNTADLRCYVRRFDALVSAVWVVQHALRSHAGSGRTFRAGRIGAQQ